MLTTTKPKIDLEIPWKTAISIYELPWKNTVEYRKSATPENNNKIGILLK